LPNTSQSRGGWRVEAGRASLAEVNASVAVPALGGPQVQKGRPFTERQVAQARHRLVVSGERLTISAKSLLRSRSDRYSALAARLQASKLANAQAQRQRIARARERTERLAERAERAAQFRAGTRLDLWLISILRSIWLNEVRARRVRVGQGIVDADSVLVFDGMRGTESQVLVNQILRLADVLPEAQRTAVHLAYVEGLSYREIAETMHVPVGTVMSRLATARTKLIESAKPAAPGIPAALPRPSTGPTGRRPREARQAQGLPRGRPRGRQDLPDAG